MPPASHYSLDRTLRRPCIRTIAGSSQSSSSSASSPRGGAAPPSPISSSATAAAAPRAVPRWRGARGGGGLSDVTASACERQQRSSASCGAATAPCSSVANQRPKYLKGERQPRTRILAGGRTRILTGGRTRILAGGGRAGSFHGAPDRGARLPSNIQFDCEMIRDERARVRARRKNALKQTIEDLTVGLLRFECVYD